MHIRKTTVTGGTSSKLVGQSAGAVDEDLFIASFEEDIPKVQLYNTKDVENEFSLIKKTLEDSNLEWEKRIDAMQRIRAIIKQKGDADEVLVNLRTLDYSFANSFKDLRSKVVREACITVSYISLKLGTKCERLIELLLPNLINLIQNSVKIMSSSALVGLRFIIQNTHSHRLIPLITLHLTSKSRDIRRAITECLYLMLTKWPTNTLDKHNKLLQDSIKKGIADADAEARIFARKAFWSYSNHFKQQADHLFHSLDPVKQKVLYNEQFGNANTLNNGLSNSHSTTSLPGTTTSRSSSSSSLARQTAALTASLINGATHKSLLLTNKSSIPVISPKAITNTNIPINKNSPVRTASAIDIGARAAALRNRNLVSKRKETNENNNFINDTRTGRTKTRISQSQPSSRSTSPTSRLNYLTNLQSNLKNGLLTNSNNQLANGSNSARRRSGIPLLSSRDSSPTRTNLERRASLSRINNKEVVSKLEKQSSSERLFYSIDNQMLKNQDFVDSFNGLINNGSNYARQNRRSINDDHSDESETSSICSDMSFTSNGRNFEDANEIIRNLSSAHWSDRKEGLIGLQYFLRKSSRPFTSEELKKITDIFTKMLVDPHTKTFSFFLEFLGEYLICYKQELRGWLFILMTRLFLKLGTDTLGSIQTKINRTLDIIQRNFTHQDQFNTIIRFLNDQTQTPTIKTKIIVLNYFHNLLTRMMSNEWVLSNGNDLKISLMKIISWTTDPKSQELRKNAQEVLVDLFNLNTVEYLNVLKQLPNTYQDQACQLTQMKRKFSSDASINNESMQNGKTSNGSSRRSSSLTRNSLLKIDNSEYENSENYNPEQVYNSLKKTTDEIQKYISSMGDNVLNNSVANSVNTNGLNDKNELDSIENGTYKSENLNGISNFLIESNDSKFKRVYKALTIGNNVKEDVQKQAYNLLVELINNANENDWNQHFKDTLSLIFDKISKDENPIIRTYSLKIMCELLYKKTKFFNNFIELTMLRILEASKDTEKEVQRTAELCAATAAVVLPGDQMIRILKAVISTSQMPVNLAAIKMLTKVIEKQTSKTIIPLLGEIMPPLIQAYDDSKIAIRKAAVSCMVSIYNCVGEEINGHLTSLSRSKMKLLELYIDKSKTNSSGSSSPISISMKSIKSN